MIVYSMQSTVPENGHELSMELCQFYSWPKFKHADAHSFSPQMAVPSMGARCRHWRRTRSGDSRTLLSHVQGKPVLMHAKFGHSLCFVKALLTLNLKP